MYFLSRRVIQKWEAGTCQKKHKNKKHTFIKGADKQRFTVTAIAGLGFKIYFFGMLFLVFH